MISFIRSAIVLSDISRFNVRGSLRTYEFSVKLLMTFFLITLPCPHLLLGPVRSYNRWIRVQEI